MRKLVLLCALALIMTLTFALENSDAQCRLLQRLRGNRGCCNVQPTCTPTYSQRACLPLRNQGCCPSVCPTPCPQPQVDSCQRSYENCMTTCHSSYDSTQQRSACYKGCNVSFEYCSNPGGRHFYQQGNSMVSPRAFASASPSGSFLGTQNNFQILTDPQYQLCMNSCVDNNQDGICDGAIDPDGPGGCDPVSGVTVANLHAFCQCEYNQRAWNGRPPFPPACPSCVE